MLSRVLPAVSLAVAPVLVGKVYAAEEPTSKKVKPRELPIYGDPPPAELEYIPEKVGPYREGVSSFRQTFNGFFTAVQSATGLDQGTGDQIKEKVEVGKAHTQDLLTYLREDSGALPRAIFITVAGLGGVVAGYKGGAVRKTLLASASMVSAASVCYPHQAVDISRAGWQRASQGAVELWRQQVGGKGETKVAKAEGEESKPPAEPAPETPKAEEPAADMKTDKVVQSKDTPKDTKKSVKNIKGDPGMSKKEDKDMYSTRT